jgi:hypothetical protein
MKSGKVVIQDAIDIVFVDTVIQCTMRNVKFEFIPREQCEAVGISVLARWVVDPIM